MLMWDKKPQSVLVIKKIWDDMVDEAFVELAAWLVQVSVCTVLATIVLLIHVAQYGL